MAKQVNIGVIGTSWWADFAFLPVLQKDERANLVAICGRNRERGDEIAAKYDIPEVYTDYREMIEQANIDAVVVSTPDDLHYEMVMAALDAGKHVLCEKPVANNAGHAREMAEKAESVGVKHLVMYTWHWLPNMKRVKQLMAEGYTGSIYNGYFHWIAGWWRNTEYRWRFDAARCNGIVGDLGSHMIHMAMWLLGDVRAVTGRLAANVQHEDANGGKLNSAKDTSTFLLEFTSGAQVQLFLTGVGNSAPAEIQLHGEKGTLHAEFNPSMEMTVSMTGQQYGSDAHLTETPEFDIMEFINLPDVGARYFVDCILNDKPCTPNLLDGYKVQQVIDAVIESDKTGCRVEIN